MSLIADRLGVSVMTVSRALAAKSPPQRKKPLELFLEIRRLAYEIGYRKSVATRAVRTGSYNNISVLGGADWRQNHMPPVRYRGLIAGALERKVGLMLSQLPEDPMKEDPSGLLGNCMCDGVLLNFILGYPEGLDERLRRFHIPAIWMNSKHDSDCIYPDDYQGSFSLCSHLVKLGHKRICLWTFKESPEAHYSVRDRRRGYEAAMSKAGLKPLKLEAPAHSYGTFIASAKEALRSSSRPTAFITYGSLEATAVRCAASELGLKTPEDLSIATFDDDRPTKETFDLTTMILPEFELGRQAVGLLVDKIANPDKPLAPVALPLVLESRASTCPPKGERP